MNKLLLTTKEFKNVASRGIKRKYMAGGREMVRIQNDKPRATNFKLREESEDSILDNEMEENEINSLTIQTFLDDEFNNETNNSFLRAKSEDDIGFKNNGSKKKKEKRRKRKNEEPKKTNTTRRIVNLPATQPYIRVVDGEERLCFKYNTKVSESAMNAMPRNDLEDNEFCVRFDLESVDITKLNEKFKADNCVYPRANVPSEAYTGNRWEYETECNRLAWQFVSLNPILLYGKKGLIQRAVDSYRNINKQSRSRRVLRQEKMCNGSLKRRHSDTAPLTVNVHWTNKGIARKCRVRVDIENVNYEKIDDDFKSRYSVFTDDFDDESFGLGRWESRNSDNELAVKIAYLNVDNTSFWNAIKANDKTSMLRKAVEAYKTRKEDYDTEEEEGNADISGIVSNTLGKAYPEGDGEEGFYFLDPKSIDFCEEKNIY